MDVAKNIVVNLCKELALSSNPAEALAMKKYMKDNFDFFGIKSPQRKLITSSYIKEFKSSESDVQKKVIDLLWLEKERECQYAAMDFSSKIENKMDETWLQFWIKKNQQKSWWDTVDYIATHCIGNLLKKNNKAEELAWKWTEDDNMWLQRTAILFQLNYKIQTNSELLFDLITAQASNKEFFIRKACGWALREYSKTNALGVSQFINNNIAILSSLTIKEGRRLIINQ